MNPDRGFNNNSFLDEYNALIFEKGMRREIYLVGGYIRDIIRGVDSRDRDFIFGGQILPFVKRLQSIIGGTIIIFSSNKTIRLALKSGYNFDFSELCETVQANLAQRDFTINALAWSPRAGLLDFYGGIADIQKRVIRCVSLGNLINDPVRMLRAYRIAAQLSGTITSETRNAIKLYHQRIVLSATERITLELFNLLNIDISSRYLKMALEDGLLGVVLSLSDDILSNNIKDIYYAEKSILQHLPPNIRVKLHDIFSQNLIYKGLLSLHILLQNHVNCNQQNIYLKMSNKIMKRLNLVRYGVQKLKKIKGTDPGKLFDIFEKIENAAADIAIITNNVVLYNEYERYNNINKKGLLSANDIMNLTGQVSGVEIGNLLRDIRRSEFAGRLSTRKVAIGYLKRMLLNI